MKLNPQHITASSRRATALIVVLVVIVMLALGAYTFSELMITEYRAADAYSRRVQSEVWAQSGVEYVAALMTPDGGGFEMDLYDNPGAFHVPLGNGGGFLVMAPLENGDGTDIQPGSPQLRMGLIDESSRIDINYLATLDPVEADDEFELIITLDPRERLIALPNMTDEIADAILDWIDADDEPRMYGAEFESYTDRTPRNGPIDSLEELLLVEGVTPQLLYGEDANRNSVLDPNEDDGDQSAPWDDEDQILNRGWSAFLTVKSIENNVQHSYDYFGESRIYVNEPLLTDLYDTLLEETGDEAIAQFITAVRMTPPDTADEEIDETAEALNELTQGLSMLFAATGDGSITRAGMDLSPGSKREIQSIYDLIDVEVVVVIDEIETTITSPWTSDAASLQQNLPMLLDLFTTTEDTSIKGRVNINQASPEVLLGIPGMTTELADAIVATRSARVPSDDPLDIYRTTGWLLIENIVDLESMRLLDEYMTVRGDIFRMQIVGYSDRPGPITRLEAVVNAAEDIPKVTFLRNLSDLGPGFQSDQLPKFVEE